MMASIGPTASKKVRSGGSRSRGACNTCKIRRVKCDELKPSCLRCEKAGRICDGYEIMKISTPTSLPKKVRWATEPRCLLPTCLAPVKCIAPIPMAISFQDELQERYFHLFHNETASELSGGFGSELWGRLVPQACHDEPCILYCAVALSALSKAFQVRGSTSLCSTAESHHQYALQQYGKALKGVREVISRGENSLRTVLITALLIFCFESFHGDVQLALTNVQSAVELMHDWLASNVVQSISPQFSPAPAVVENSIVTAFTRLDIHLMSWMDSPHPVRGSILRYASTGNEPVPSAFKTLQQASTSFEHTVNRVFQFLGSVPATKRRCLDLPYNDIYDKNGNQFVESNAATELRAWSAAFKSLFNQTRDQTLVPEFVGAALLQVHALILEISMRSAFFNPGEVHLYGAFLPEYCEIVALCRRIAHHPRFVRSFVFDSGIVSPLFVVVTKCPDLAVRQEALSILKRLTPRREGVWDSCMVVRIGEDLMRFEDGNDAGTNDGVQVHLNCLSTTFRLPKLSNAKQQEKLAMLNYFCDYMANQYPRT